jgi:hypothetical protein
VKLNSGQIFNQFSINNKFSTGFKKLYFHLSTQITQLWKTHNKLNGIFSHHKVELQIELLWFVG